MLRTCAASVALVATVVPAPVQGQTDADTREVVAYVLTTGTLQKVAAAQRTLAVSMKADPRVARLKKLKAEKKQLEAKEEITDADAARLDALEGEIEAAEGSLTNLLEGARTLRDVEANVRKEPQLAAALSSAGLAPREYGTFMLALLQASMVHGMQKAGAMKDLPRDLQGKVNLENVKFVAAHEAEIERMMAEAAAMVQEP